MGASRMQADVEGIHDLDIRRMYEICIYFYILLTLMHT